MGALISLSKTATSSWLKGSELALLVFALVVVVGLIGENKLPWWHHRLRVFEVLVTIGCGGELFADFGVFLFSRQLENLSNQEIAQLQRDTELVKRDNLRLRAAIAGRELTTEQQRKIGSALQSFSGKTVRVMSYRGDGEAKRLGLEIGSALGLAHIHFGDNLEGLDNREQLLLGIEVTCAEDALHSDRPFAKALIAALSDKDEGSLSVLPLSELGCPSDEITEIHIGVKPPTFPEQSSQELSAVSKATDLRAERISRLSLTLRKFRGQAISMFWYTRDTKGNELARDIVRAIGPSPDGAGWDISADTEESSHPVNGILILLSPRADNKDRLAASALIQALRKEKLSVADAREDPNPSGLLSLNNPSNLGPAPITVVLGRQP